MGVVNPWWTRLSPGCTVLSLVCCYDSAVVGVELSVAISLLFRVVYAPLPRPFSRRLCVISRVLTTTLAVRFWIGSIVSFYTGLYMLLTPLVVFSL